MSNKYCISYKRYIIAGYGDHNSESRFHLGTYVGTERFHVFSHHPSIDSSRFIDDVFINGFALLLLELGPLVRGSLKRTVLRDIALGRHIRCNVSRARELK